MPTVLEIILGLKFIFFSLNFVVSWISKLDTSPPQISSINFAAVCNPNLIEFGSMPLSNLNLASLLISNFFEVFLVNIGSK